MCVGINPNLPGWTSSTRNAIHPYFDDYCSTPTTSATGLVTSCGFPKTTMRRCIGVTPDDRRHSTRRSNAEGKEIPVEQVAGARCTEQYQTLLDGLAARKNWQNHKLAVGEDISYANMVACPSTRWVVKAEHGDPGCPSWGRLAPEALSQECFFERRYFPAATFPEPARHYSGVQPDHGARIHQRTSDAFLNGASRTDGAAGAPLSARDPPALWHVE